MYIIVVLGQPMGLLSKEVCLYAGADWFKALSVSYRVARGQLCPKM